MKLLQKPDWGLVVPYPAEWRVIDEATYVTIAMSVTIGQSRSGAYPMDVNADFEFTVARDPSYTNPEANLFSILKDVVVTKEGLPADQLKDMQMADSPARTVDGRDARAATFSGSAEYWDVVTEVTGEVDLLSVGEQGYAIVSRGPSGAWPQYREALPAMLEGVRFDGPTEGELPPAK